MSDIFISYAREDRALAEALANDLKTQGYGVWWDTELVGSDDFQEVILAALSKAKAAIVIWTKASVNSLFVRDEARYALHYKKLVAVKALDVDVLDIPFGFQGQHTDDVGNRDQIVRAVAKLGAVCSPPPAPRADTWEALRDTGDVSALLDWLERNPAHEKRPDAFRRVRTLMDAKPEKPPAEQTPRSIARMSSLSAFLSGLTFRVPYFLPTRLGNAAALGLALAHLLSGPIAISLLFSTFHGRSLEEVARKPGATLATSIWAPH